MIDLLKHSRAEETVVITMNPQIDRKDSADNNNNNNNKLSPSLRRNSSSPRSEKPSDSQCLSKSWNGRANDKEATNTFFKPHEYSKVNTRTGGFESALPNQLVEYYDDTDSGSNDKARSLPPPLIAQMATKHDSPHPSQPKLVKDRVRTVQNKKQHRREGFFHRLGLTKNHHNNNNNKTPKATMPETTNQLSRKNRPRSLPLRMRSHTSSTSMPESGFHTVGSVFVLPDQKPGKLQERRQQESDTDIAVVQQPRRDQHGMGFEVEIVNEHERKEDDTSTVNSWVVRLNCTEGDLLENASSPGALLLTEEGLKRHEMKTSPKNGTRENSTKSKHRLSNKSSKMVRPFGLLRRKSTETHDLANFSLAPLITMEDLPTEATSQKRSTSDPSISCQIPFKIPFLKSTRSRSALELIERERQAAEEAEMKRKTLQAMEKQEKDRIERKRREYLQRERSRESVSTSRQPSSSPLDLSAQQRESIFYSLEHSDDDGSPQKTAVTRSTMSASIEPMNNTRHMPSCAACGLTERTHIAVPCMHFALCRECAFRRARKQEGCFVCQKIDVTFTTVSM
jgi:hypothetical protein